MVVAFVYGVKCRVQPKAAGCSVHTAAVQIKSPYGAAPALLPASPNLLRFLSSHSSFSASIPFWRSHHTMPITRTALRQPRPILPRPSCGGMLTRQLHATARRPHSTGPAQHATELPAKKVYRDFFPCTLHYYSCHGPTMAMHATSSSPSSDDDKVDNRLGQDVVRVQEDGLIYPGPEGTDSVWNGAMLMPLATFLLDITENYHDVYEEQKAAGHDLPEPYFLTVPKGGLCLNLAAGGRLGNLNLASQDYGYPVLFFWLTNMGRCSTLCPA